MNKIFRGNLQSVRKQIADELALKGSLTGSQTWTGVNTFSPSSDGGQIVSLTSENGSRSVQISAPVNANIADPFIFSTGNAFEFEVDSISAFSIGPSGNIGIGITPDTKLHVDGAIKLESVTLDATPEAGKIEFANDRFYITNTDNQKVIDRTGGVITATSALTNSTVETTLFTGTLDADELTADTLIKYFVYGSITNASASDDITIRVYIGTTLVETFSAAIGNVTGAVVEVTGQFTVRSVGVSGSVAYRGNVVVDGFTDRAASIENIDTTVSEDITVTFQWNNAKAGNTVSVTQGHVEFKD